MWHRDRGTQCSHVYCLHNCEGTPWPMSLTPPAVGDAASHPHPPIKMGSTSLGQNYKCFLPWARFHPPCNIQTWPQNNLHLTHLGLLYTAGQHLEQLQQWEEAPENDAVRNIQSTQLQQEDRLQQHYSQRCTETLLKGREGNVGVILPSKYISCRLAWCDMEYQK